MADVKVKHVVDWRLGL